MSPGPLDGLRVCEWGESPLATRLTGRFLADLGADVVSLENSRHEDRPYEGIADFGKSIVRLEDPAVRDLLSRADCLIVPEEASIPTPLSEVVAESSRMIVTRVSSGGGDLSACARSAVSIILGEPGRPPLHFPFRIPSLQAAYHAVAATLVALHERSRSGRGQQVRVDASEVLASYAGGMSLFIRGSGGEWKRRGFERHGGIYPSGFYPCRDGYVFLATQSRRPWQGFLQLMGDPEWSHSDPAFRDGKAIGWKRAEEVDLHFIPWLLQHSRAELVELVRDVEGIILGPIHRADEALAVPHFEARGFWNEATVEGTKVRLPGHGYRFSRTPARLGPPPRREAPQWDAESPKEAGSPGAGRGALSGIRVLEFGWNWAGPMVGALLGDFGAEVIKVETRRRQDFMRHWNHARAFFHNGNRNKRSVTIDIAKPEGVELVLELARHVDVVFENFAAGVLERRGLGAAALHQANPRLVVMSMAMAGQVGPLRHLRGFATMATGFAGVEHAIGYDDHGSTGLPLIGLGDMNASTQGVVAILAALRHRDRTGEGQFIDISQIDAATALVAEPLLRYQLEGTRTEPSGNAVPDFAPHGIYPAAGEDRWIALAVRSDEEWQALVRILGAPDWAREESVATEAGRLARRETLDARLAEWTASEDRDALARKLRDAGLAAEPVLELKEMMSDRGFTERGLWVRLEDDDAPNGSWRLFSTPWHLDRTPRRIERLAPEIGADNRWMAVELLGRSEPEVADLERSGVMQ